MIIITGLGRTGTTFFALWLREMGFIKYDHGYTPAVNAGVEPIDVSQLNNQIMKGEVTFEEVEAQIKGFDYSVIKDPRFLYKNVLDYWVRARKDLKFLLLHRNVRDVRNSRLCFDKVLREKNSAYILSEEQMHAAVGRFVGECAKNNFFLESIYYPNFLDQYDLVWDKCRHLGLGVEYHLGKEVWEGLMDKSKIHHESR